MAVEIGVTSVISYCWQVIFEYLNSMGPEQEQSRNHLTDSSLLMAIYKVIQRLGLDFCFKPLLNMPSVHTDVFINAKYPC